MVPVQSSGTGSQDFLRHGRGVPLSNSSGGDWVSPVLEEVNDVKDEEFEL
jgi:hypothetical protein